jgi:hypothetical protein
VGNPVGTPVGMPVGFGWSAVNDSKSALIEASIENDSSLPPNLGRPVGTSVGRPVGEPVGRPAWPATPVPKALKLPEGIPEGASAGFE